MAADLAARLDLAVDLVADHRSPDRLRLRREPLPVLARHRDAQDLVTGWLLLEMGTMAWWLVFVGECRGGGELPGSVLVLEMASRSL